MENIWIEHFGEEKFISMIYNNVPPLENLRIEKIEITREGDRISVAFDLPIYADKPPRKWIERGYTTTYVEIDFFYIKEVSLKSNNNKYRGNIDIKKDVDIGDLIVHIGGTVEANIKAGAGLIQSVSGY
ncbi:Imm50 family immunity protein [Bacillus sp. JJ664]